MERLAAPTFICLIAIGSGCGSAGNTSSVEMSGAALSSSEQTQMAGSDAGPRDPREEEEGAVGASFGPAVLEVALDTRECDHDEAMEVLLEWVEELPPERRREAVRQTAERVSREQLGPMGLRALMRITALAGKIDATVELGSQQQSERWLEGALSEGAIAASRDGDCDLASRFIDACRQAGCGVGRERSEQVKCYARDGKAERALEVLESCDGCSWRDGIEAVIEAVARSGDLTRAVNWIERYAPGIGRQTVEARELHKRRAKPRAPRPRPRQTPEQRESAAEERELSAKREAGRWGAGMVAAVVNIALDLDRGAEALELIDLHTTEADRDWARRIVIDKCVRRGDLELAESLARVVADSRERSWALIEVARMRDSRTESDARHELTVEAFGEFRRSERQRAGMLTETIAVELAVVGEVDDAWRIARGEKDGKRRCRIFGKLAPKLCAAGEPKRATKAMAACDHFPEVFGTYLAACSGPGARTHATRLLSRLRKDDGLSTGSLEAIARHCASEGGCRPAAEVLAGIEPPEQRQRMFDHVFVQLARDGDLEAAWGAFGELGYDGRSRVTPLLIEGLVRAGELDRAQEIVKRLKGSQQQAARRDLAFAVASSGDDERAFELAAEFDGQDEFTFWLRLASGALERGDYLAAMERAERIWSRPPADWSDPDQPEVSRHRIDGELEQLVQEYGARGQLERALLFASLIRWDATRHKMLRELAREIGRADTAPPVGEPELLRLIVERINGRAGSCDR